MTDVLDGAPSPQDQPVLEVGRLPGLLRVHTNQGQHLPDCLEQEVEVELHVAADDDSGGETGQPVHFFDRHLINLVVNVEARKVDAVRANDVYQFVGGAVFPEENLENRRKKFKK
jgi:hypothetical protein